MHKDEARKTPQRQSSAANQRQAARVNNQPRAGSTSTSEKTKPSVALAITPERYRADPLCPRIERAVLAILGVSNVVATVDVLVRMGTLRAEDLEAWLFGRIPYLERVTLGNLSKMRRILRILGFLCHDLNLGASQTAYVRWGKGQRTPLRFTKTSEERLEKVYARHFVWPGKNPFCLPAGYKVLGAGPKDE